jgi:transcriptional regulator with XRE-family HTH domain
MYKLIDELCNYQIQSGQDDEEFARQLGMSRQLWNAIRHGHRRLTVKHLGRVLITYPDIERVVLDYLKRQAGGEP